jgi:N-acyl-phosphatidylethanolamine-hydrolysing phospholipase D
MMMALTAACALPPEMGPASPRLPQLPEPFRALCLLGIVADSILLPPQASGAPATRALAGAALRDGTVTWLGHSGFLIRLGGQSVLVDPILSDRLGTPLSPPRLAAAPILALDRVDLVLVSHEDHDHYDLPTLRGIARAFPDAVLVGPPDLTPDPDLLGFAAVLALPAWDSRSFGGLTVTATPALHYGRRDMIGLAPHPALGWALRAGEVSLFHAGDTAHGPVHAEIGARLGPFDLALVPIGAWAPERVVGDVHACPEHALDIAAAVGAGQAVAMHWGTFALSPDSPADDLIRFAGAARPGLPAPVVLDIGETLAIAP